MIYPLTVIDETTHGRKSAARTLEFLEEIVTAREILRRRIYQDVQDHNLNLSPISQNLVQPTETEKQLNGERLKTRPLLSWEAQFEVAQSAFDQAGFIMLVNDLQIESLEETVHLKLGQPTEVTFLKLIPLVGG